MNQRGLVFIAIGLGIVSILITLCIGVFWYLPEHQRSKNLTCGFCEIVRTTIDKRFTNYPQTPYWILYLTIKPFGDINERCCQNNVTAQELTFTPDVSAFRSFDAAMKRAEKWTDTMLLCWFDYTTGIIQDGPNDSIPLIFLAFFSIVTVIIVFIDSFIIWIYYKNRRQGYEEV